METVFLSTNKFKHQELLHFFPGLRMQAADLPEIQGIEPMELIREKLRAAKVHNFRSFLVEDISLHLHALNGFPGALIKWMLGTLHADGVAELIQNYADHRATGKCVIGFFSPEVGELYVEGVVEGQIVLPRGKGWGFDSIFVPDGHEKTFGEMSDIEKQHTSMRGRAAESMLLAIREALGV